MNSDDHDDPEIGQSNQGSGADDDGLPVGGRERPARRYLAIGELLDTLRPEFPDLTLSKIRFLEQQGLLEPERTPSGYRKFFSGQVERLWWILDQQRDGYIPLKEIRQRLAAAEASGILSPLSTPPSAPADPKASVHRLEPRVSAVVAPIPMNRSAEAPARDDSDELDSDHDHDDAHDPSLRHAPKEALGESRHPSSVARRVQHAFAAIAGEHDASTGPDVSGRTTSRAGSTESSRRSSTTDRVPSPATSIGSGATAGVPASSATDTTAAPSVVGPGVAKSAVGASGSTAVGGRSVRPAPSGAGQAPSHRVAVTAAGPGGGGPAGSAERRRPTDASAQANETSESPAAHSGRTPATDNPNQPYGSANPLIGQYTGASFTFDELVRASGLEPDELRQLESFGLLAGHQVLGATYYDEDALLAARAAHGFKQFGIEPRHMRIYRTMADRESGFLEQIVSPLVHRRQQAARTVAADQLEELIALGTQLRLVALRRLLRASLDGR